MIEMRHCPKTKHAWVNILKTWRLVPCSTMNNLQIITFLYVCLYQTHPFNCIHLFKLKMIHEDKLSFKNSHKNSEEEDWMQELRSRRLFCSSSPWNKCNTHYKVTLALPSSPLSKSQPLFQTIFLFICFHNIPCWNSAASSKALKLNIPFYLMTITLACCWATLLQEIRRCNVSHSFKNVLHPFKNLPTWHFLRSSGWFPNQSKPMGDM